MALALDSSDNLHTVYTVHNMDDDSSNHGIAYIGWKQPWARSANRSTAKEYLATGIDLDDQDYPWVCRFLRGPTDSAYTFVVESYTGSGWQTTTLATNLNGGEIYARACDIDYHSPSLIGVTYYNENRLIYAFSTDGGGGWVSETVTLPGAGQHNSLAIDGTGVPHISYTEGAYLRYAMRIGTYSWSSSLVGPDGSYNRIALKSDGTPAVSYYNSGFPYDALRSGSSWSNTKLGSSGSGWDTSLAFDSNDLPHITYYDYTSLELILATYSGSSWDYTIVDDGTDGVLNNNVGEMSFIGINELNRWTVTYRDLTAKTLKTARQEPLAPSGVLLCSEAENEGGAGSTLVLDPHGNPRVNHNRTLDNMIRYISRP